MHEDLANAGSFNDQEHSVGPTLFWKPGGGEEGEEVRDVGEAAANGGNGDDGKQPEPANTHRS